MLPSYDSGAVGGIRSSMSALGLEDDHNPLKDIELPRQPPPGFDHLSSTHDELLKHGFPPAPDPEAFPDQYRHWERIFSSPPVLASGASVKLIDQDPQTVHGLAPLTTPQGVLETAGTEHPSSWSGAIIKNADNDGDLRRKKATFGMVSASWTVARPYPPSSSRKDSGWANGDFQASTWVGMGGSTSSPTSSHGFETHGPSRRLPPRDLSSLLCAGIAQRCIVKDGAMDYVTYPWFAWHPSSPVEISGFAVNPGDLVSVFIGGFSLDINNYWFSSDTQRITTAFVFFNNRSNCTYFSARVNAPYGISLKADMAKWIVQCPSPPQQTTTPFLGTNFIHDCWFISNGVKQDLGDAVLSNVVTSGGNATLLQASRENNSVLRIYSESRPDDIQIKTSQKIPRVVIYHQSDAPLSPLVYVPLATGRGSHAATHVNIATLHLNEDTSTGKIWVTLNDARPDDDYFAPLWKDVKTLQAYGVKVLAMLGGEAGGVFSRLDNATNPDKFEKSYGVIKNVIDTYHLDGVDLDIEESMTQSGINTLIDRIVDDFGKNFIITLAPVASALRGGDNLSKGVDYVTLEKEKGSKIAWYNAQFYSGFGTMEYTDDYVKIINNKFEARRVVAGVLTNKIHGGGYIELDTLKKTLKKLKETYGNEFGGVAGWDYQKSLPDEMSPWKWAQVMRDTLG
ncbi:glycoside hydrolase superfamily [Nemania sp. NC0429]|nr:glycoside hydrolase superfamily [Nemania sp. NC0429]